MGFRKDMIIEIFPVYHRDWEMLRAALEAHGCRARNRNEEGYQEEKLMLGFSKDESTSVWSWGGDAERQAVYTNKKYELMHPHSFRTDVLAPNDN